jgi:hypothetical protein
MTASWTIPTGWSVRPLSVAFVGGVRGQRSRSWRVTPTCEPQLSKVHVNSRKAAEQNPHSMRNRPPQWILIPRHGPEATMWLPVPDNGPPSHIMGVAGQCPGRVERWPTTRCATSRSPVVRRGHPGRARASAAWQGAPRPRGRVRLGRTAGCASAAQQGAPRPHSRVRLGRTAGCAPAAQQGAPRPHSRVRPGRTARCAPAAQQGAPRPHSKVHFAADTETGRPHRVRPHRAHVGRHRKCPTREMA